MYGVLRFRTRIATRTLSFKKTDDLFYFFDRGWFIADLWIVVYNSVFHE